MESHCCKLWSLLDFRGGHTRITFQFLNREFQHDCSRFTQPNHPSAGIKNDTFPRKLYAVPEIRLGALKMFVSRLFHGLDAFILSYPGLNFTVGFSQTPTPKFRACIKVSYHACIDYAN